MKPSKIKTMALLLSAIVFISCGSKQEDETNENEPKNDILLSETLNLNVQLSQYGKAKQIAKAPRMLQFSGSEGKYSTFPDGIYVESFTDSLTLESTIDAKFAKMKEGRNEFYTAYDSVVVTNYIQGIKIITDTLYWDRMDGKIYNYCYTKFFIPDGDLDAWNGMWALEDLTDYELRTIREGNLLINRQSKNDSAKINTISFPDTAEIQPKLAPVENKPAEKLVIQEERIPIDRQLQKRENKHREIQKIDRK